MKKILKCLPLLILSITLLLQSGNMKAVIAEEQKKELTILFTHDLHDNFLPLKYLENGEVVMVGGYARLMTAIIEEKKKDVEALLVDGGDFSMGTPFQTIYQSDAPGLRILGAMGYDVVTLGNHEFDYRPAGLIGTLNSSLSSGEKLPQIVQSNMYFPKDKEGNLTKSLEELQKAVQAYGFKDYTIIESNGYKIGVFGVMGEESASMAPMSEVTFPDEIKEAKRVVKILKEQEKVDFILCLSHSGTDDDKSLSEDEILAKEVPDINVIVSGHSHTELPEPILVGNTIVASCGEYGRNLGVIKLSPAGEEWTLNQYELVPINENLAEDDSIQDKIVAFKDLVQTKYFDEFDMEYDEVVATSDVQFQTPGELAAVHAEATIGNLISDSYIYAVKKAEGDNYDPIAAAIVPCGTIRNTIYSGEITTADAFSISSLGIGADGMPGYPLISVYLNGKELKTACEVDASITPLMDDAQLFMSGMNFTFNPKRLIFNKVTDAYLVNESGMKEDIDDKKLYRVVCGLYSAQMLSVVGDKSYGLMSIVPKDKNGKAISDFEKHIIYEEVEDSKRELKEWYAVVQYLQSFHKEEGLSKIPEDYKTVQGRKIVQDDGNLIAILSKPNHIALTVYIVVPSILVLLGFSVFLFMRKIKNRKLSRKKRVN